MAIIANNYVGNGSTVLYSFTFPYLAESDVKVSLNGTATTNFIFANATTLQLSTAPANGVAIRIYRETADDDLAATFYPGSAIRAQDLNENFTQNLYVTQETKGVAEDAVGIAEGAVTTAQGAVTTANSAVTSANAAVTTANTASSTASSSVSTANSANTTAASAVTTANNAVSTANGAVTTADSAVSTAQSAVTTATTASANATTAVNTANSAVSTANSAVSTANTASTNATNAVNTANAANSTANTAVSTANSAVSTANTANSNASTAVTSAQGAVNTALAADTKADQAIAAVANAILYDLVANVAAIPASPSNNDAIEIQDSTGIQSFTPLSGLPSGFVGDSGLSVRLVYSSATTSWVWIQYFSTDPETRYGDAITAVEGDVSQLQTDVLALDSAKLDATTAASTYLTQSNAASTYAVKNNTTLTGTTSADFVSLSVGATFLDDSETKSISLTAPAALTNSATLLTLPNGAGSTGQLLSTDGTGVLSWVTPPVTATLVDGGSFDNGTSTVNVSSTIEGGAF